MNAFTSEHQELPHEMLTEKTISICSFIDILSSLRSNLRINAEEGIWIYCLSFPGWPPVESPHWRSEIWGYKAINTSGWMSNKELWINFLKLTSWHWKRPIKLLWIRFMGDTVKTYIKEQVDLRTLRLKFSQKSSIHIRTNSAWKMKTVI